MSSLSGRSQLAIQLVFIALMMPGSANSQNGGNFPALTCPSAIEVTQTGKAIPGWTSRDAASRRTFERVSIYNVAKDGKEFDLAPDGQSQEHNRTSQVWNLKGYRTMSIFLGCRYKGTQIVMSKEIPSGYEECKFEFDSGKTGSGISKPSFACR